MRIYKHKSLFFFLAQSICIQTQARISFKFDTVDISLPQHAEWHALYRYEIPVVHIDGQEVARHGLQEADFVARLLESGHA